MRDTHQNINANSSSIINNSNQLINPANNVCKIWFN